MFTSNQRARHLSMVPLQFSALSRPRLPARIVPTVESLHDDPDLAAMQAESRPLIAGGEGRPHVWPADILPARMHDSDGHGAGFEAIWGELGGAVGIAMFLLGAFAGGVITWLIAV